ncbi:hypothetical protein NDU88_003043 [Pleurodeles waltl]|uniref:Uncharacterized protein n=1 Tax=Pleurodeles waltl TaxID=8319 RepID=A0AAV7PCN7_PLEWA|nr:hypothetical protein NDU88_003043 [Pleurodeles waltl]
MPCLPGAADPEHPSEPGPYARLSQGGPHSSDIASGQVLKRNTFPHPLFFFATPELVTNVRDGFEHIAVT